MNHVQNILAGMRQRTDLLNLIHYEANICEVGVRKGEFLKLMALRGPRYLLGVDIWEWAETTGQNDIDASYNDLLGFRLAVTKDFDEYDNVEIRQAYSADAAASADDNYFHLVYLDADHTYEAVKLDLESWWPKVKAGGVLAGHDYVDVTTENGSRFGVVQAVNEFAATHRLKLYFDEDYWKTWAVQKPY